MYYTLLKELEERSWYVSNTKKKNANQNHQVPGMIRLHCVCVEILHSISKRVNMKANY